MGPRRRHGSRRAGVAAAAVLAALIAAGAGAWALRGDDAGEPSPTVDAVRAALLDRLAERQLSWKRVVCLRDPQSHDGRPVFRCNVDFGDPHIVIYCAQLTGGELRTQVEEPAIRCGRPGSTPELP